MKNKQDKKEEEKSQYRTPTTEELIKHFRIKVKEKEIDRVIQSYGLRPTRYKIDHMPGVSGEGKPDRMRIRHQLEQQKLSIALNNFSLKQIERKSIRDFIEQYGWRAYAKKKVVDWKNGKIWKLITQAAPYRPIRSIPYTGPTLMDKKREEMGLTGKTFKEVYQTGSLASTWAPKQQPATKPLVSKEDINTLHDAIDLLKSERAKTEKKVAKKRAKKK